MEIPPEVLDALGRVREDMGRIGESVQNPSLRAAIRYYIETPGKMIRPLLLLLFTYVLDPERLKDERIINAAALLEVLHIVSLLQDDVVDKHDARRGVETPRAIYGDGMAIVASDWLIAEAIERAVSISADAVKYLAGVAKRLAEGQALDIEGLRKEAAELKTAPLIEAAFVMPTMILSRRDLLRPAAALGRLLGVLYQYSDDMADEGAKREMTPLVDEIRSSMKSLRRLLGEKIVPLERFVEAVIAKALEGTLTTAKL
ncbi:Polyprenyl synthetase [Thermoproteus uzoniensis 768-20]|uniref:Polyprenyl synthetase n=1 Tax=Thermoproteus uzoniensis (strain 768-20) TaxID=999630 RepID=F2L2N9_THEU7|nr:polyprenyl synthetase family protein [Thermoproteus uzoniensis]AEA13087.1 Polyprenyl synthetase [Thermoproteus uzoniensis 768-20]